MGEKVRVRKINEKTRLSSEWEEAAKRGGKEERRRKWQDHVGKAETLRKNRIEEGEQQKVKE